MPVPTRAGTDTNVNSWTYGSEHELADWDAQLDMPGGLYRTPDHTVMNSNGIAAQPNPSVYKWGGEINTPPSATPEGQVQLLELIKSTYPGVSVNHRSNLHIHVRVPGLKEDLVRLKQLQKCIHAELPSILPYLEPIPKGDTPAARKRARRRKVSHQTFLSAKRLEHQLASRTVAEFFEREVPVSKAGAIMWHAQPRVCVNLRQLLQTDTVEFRHFPGTLSGVELLACTNWCVDFLDAAFHDLPLGPVWKTYRGSGERFPVFSEFREDLEIVYQATASKNGLVPTEVKRNIGLVLAGTFEGTQEYIDAAERAGVMPRK